MVDLSTINKIDFLFEVFQDGFENIYRIIKVVEDKRNIIIHVLNKEKVN